MTGVASQDSRARNDSGMATTNRRPPTTARPHNPTPRNDDGMAMITAVIVSSLLVTITAALLLSIDAGGARSVRQRDYYQARATGASAMSYLYAQLREEADFFKTMLTNHADPCSQSSPPAECEWIDVSTATEPSATVQSDWRRFNYDPGGDLTQVVCDSRRTPCWVLRFKAEPGTAGSTPETVVAEAIVRYNCRFGAYCSTMRFQQHLELESSEWTRRDLTQVTGQGKLSP